MNKFNTDYQGLAHHWVYADQSYRGECYGNRMFAINDNMFSYGHHYVIAKKIRDKKGNITAYLFNSNSNSITTNKQRNIVRRAIPNNIPLFDVPNLTDRLTSDFHNKVISTNISYLLDLTQKIDRARLNREQYINEFNSIISFIKEYMTFFKFKYRFKKAEKTLLNGDYSTGNSNKVKKAYKEAATRKARMKRIEAEKALKRAIEVEAKQIKEWLSNDRKNLFLNVTDEDFLRLSEDKERIETTQGINIGIKEGYRLCKLMSSGLLKEGDKVAERYNIDKIDERFIIIGCHKISIKTAKDMCSQLNKL